MDVQLSDRHRAGGSKGSNPRTRHSGAIRLRSVIEQRRDSPLSLGALSCASPAGPGRPSRPSPWRCFGSTTRWVTARATGSMTTRATSPQTASVQLASAPIVNCVVSAIATFLVVLVPMVPSLPAAAAAGIGRCLRLKSQPAGWVRDLHGHHRLASREVSDRADGGRTRDRLVRYCANLLRR